MVDTVERTRRRAIGPIRLLASAVLAAAMLVACGEDPQTDFTPANRSDFMAACSQPLDDGPLITSVCQCVFERSQDEIPFADFAEIDAALRADPAAVLPVEITDLVAECFIEEAEL
ncbi:MAG: hypothetical protein AAF547_20605 [Actinomycetota bacterium]